ncbi:MAG TPA: hypothetical protein VHE35_24720 [Kofleriaceae bacterium]|nr:hypothetical protein [Kofleriaceae bacterium]
MRTPSILTTAPALAALAFAAAGAACDKAVDLELVRAPEAEGVDVDLSCIQTLEVIALPHDPTVNVTYACVDVPAGAIRSLDDHDLGGLLDMRTPDSGAANVVLHAYDAPECGGSPILIGGAALDGAHVQVPLAPVAGCDQRVTAARTLRVVDFFAMVERKACESPDAGPIAAGILFGNRFDPDIPLEFYGASFPEPPSAGVIATTAGFRDAVLSACPGAVAGGTEFTSAACVYADAPGACAAAGDQGTALELAYVSPSDFTRSLDPTLTADWATAVLGVVVDAHHDPIAGAHVFLRGGPGKVVYTHQAARTLTAISASATDETGTFILYADSPQRVDVIANGHTRQLRVGGWMTTDPVGSATIISM